MKEFKTDYIRGLINIMNNNELTEIMLEDADKSVLIKRDGFKPVIKEKKTAGKFENVQSKPQQGGSINNIGLQKKKLVPIISEMIGLYFSKPSPDEKPFVKEGDEIKQGQVICIIETIKLINKITSDYSGKVAEICMEDGKPVEYGQVIMYIEQTE